MTAEEATCKLSNDLTYIQVPHINAEAMKDFKENYVEESTYQQQGRVTLSHARIKQIQAEKGLVKGPFDTYLEEFTKSIETAGFRLFFKGV